MFSTPTETLRLFLDLSSVKLLSGNACYLEEILESVMTSFVDLTHSHTMTPLTPLGNKPFENTVGKGEIARNEQFLLFPQCFLPVWITFCYFRQI